MLGQFNLEGIAPARRGQPQIEVSLDIDANGILKVSAKDKNTGQENKITIKANSGLSEDEIEKMIKDAEANADEDKKTVELISARNIADAHVSNLRKEFETHKESLSEEERANINIALADIEAAIKESDKDAINESVTRSYESCASLFEKVAKAQQPESKEVKEDDSVVDAEFTEVKKEV
jgi:molecular chaperone DnaK